MELSKRLQAVTDLISQGTSVADIGCDHGYVSIALVQRGISQRVLAMDVNTGPLERAQEHIRQYGMEAYIQTKLSDGLAYLLTEEGKSRKVDTLLMAGMGGRLMIHILQEGKPISEQTAEWILQPQSEISLVRQYIRTQQYHISEENMVLEDGKYYVMMKAEPKQLPGTVSLIPMQLCDAYGEYLLQNQHPVLRQYLYARRTHLLGLMQTLTEEGKPSAKLVTRLSELTQEAAQIELALTYFT